MGSTPLVGQKGVGRGTYYTIKQTAVQMRCKIRAIEFLKEHKRITSKKDANLFGIVDRMARNDLRKLVNKKIIRRAGASDKTSYYILAEI